MSVHNNVKRFIDQRYHRNGVGGDGGVVTYFTSSEGDDLVAVTLSPALNEATLTPPDWFKRDEPEEKRYAAWWVDTFARQTIVINPADPTAKYRGRDAWGFEIANEYRRRHITGEAYPGQGVGSDPATEWYRDVTADPAETARLTAENNVAVEDLLGLPKGTLS